MILHEKNSFAERCKILTQIRKVILLDYQNNYRTFKLVAKISKFLQHCISCSNFLHNYFDGFQQNYLQFCIQ